MGLLIPKNGWPTHGAVHQILQTLPWKSCTLKPDFSNPTLEKLQSKARFEDRALPPLPPPSCGHVALWAYGRGGGALKILATDFNISSLEKLHSKT